MNQADKTKQLMKIVIGAAWIDGMIQEEEREYLQKMVQEKGLNDDQEIKNLLSETKSVSPQQCYTWLEEYLGQNHHKKDYQNLLEAISGLVYSDGNIAVQEAKLLNQIENFDPDNQTPKSIFTYLLGSVKKIYRKAL